VGKAALKMTKPHSVEKPASSKQAGALLFW
jgi:hypothetical protein